jgi:sugar phosphate isomerase/epimerase
MLVATAWTSAGNVSPMDEPALSPVPIEQRVAAVAAAGFTGMGLIADDLRVIRDGIGFSGLRDLLDHNAFTHVEIELIERWWVPRGEPGHTYEVRDLLFDAADVLQPSFIKIGSQHGSPCDDVGPLVPALGELADQAVAHGTRIAIETMPFSALATVPLGAELITAMGHPAVGLLVDAWHVFRAGTSLDELRAALAPGMVYGVELDDAAAEVVGTLFEDTVERRLLCGEGSFDLPGLIAVLRGTGFDGPWGVEILSSEFRALPVAAALDAAAVSARRCLALTR